VRRSGVRAERRPRGQIGGSLQNIVAAGRAKEVNLEQVGGEAGGGDSQRLSDVDRRGGAAQAAAVGGHGGEGVIAGGQARGRERIRHVGHGAEVPVVRVKTYYADGIVRCIGIGGDG